MPTSLISNIISASNTEYIDVAISALIPESPNNFTSSIWPALVLSPLQFASGTRSNEKPKINLFFYSFQI